MENKKLTFSVDAGDIDIKKLLQKDFIELSIKAISSANPNRNNSWFTRESMEKSKHTFANKPILGYFENGDFVSHNGSWDHDDETGLDYWNTLGRQGERILGVIRDSDSVEIIEDNKGLSWIKVSCVLWVEYNFKQVKRLLKDAKKAKADGGLAKNVSVEVDITDYTELPNGVMQINEFNLVGITILGSRNGVKVEPGIEDAGLSIIDIMGRDVFEKQSQAVRLAYEKLDNSIVKQKEELSTMEENQEVIVESVEEKKEVFEEETIKNEEHLEETLSEDENKEEGCKECEEHTESETKEETKVCEEECPCEPESETLEVKEAEEKETEEAPCCEDVEKKEEECLGEEDCSFEESPAEETKEETPEEDKKEDECKYAELEAQFNELKEKYESLNKEYESVKAQLESKNDYETIKEKLNVYEHKEFLDKASKLIKSGNLNEVTSKKLFEACDANEITNLDDLKVKVALEAFEGNTLVAREETQKVEEHTCESLNIPVSTPEISTVFNEVKKNTKRDSWAVLNEYVGK